MATVKTKFRPSTVNGKEGVIYYQVIHNRTVRQLKTSYHLYAHEWNNRLKEVVLTESDEKRNSCLLTISDNIELDLQRFNRIITSLNQDKRPYTSDDIITSFSFNQSQHLLFPFMEETIAQLKALGKIRTSETYASTLNSFKRFRENKDLVLDKMNSDMVMAYEAYLKSEGVCPNSSSFYMRNLRAVYNRAVDKGLTTQRFPFKHVYTGVDKTAKRAVSLKVIKRLKEMDFSANATLDYARDMFLFSFYTRGMSFVDMAYLLKKNLSNGILAYRRQKTGQQLFIRWEKCMQEIVEKYDTSQSPYLLPVIKPQSHIEVRRQYIYGAHNINKSLKLIGWELGLSIPLTLYVARHAWASIARSKNVPLSVISEGMGHDSENTTRIYLASLDTAAIDKANSLILNSL